MKVDGRHFRSIWLEDDGWTVGAIDQRRLPHEFVVARIRDAGTRPKPSVPCWCAARR
jgi:methylthioribose-1-phosphate isomerase